MSPSEPVPAEVLAIAVALTVLWSDMEAGAQPVEATTTGEWRLGGRRWERPAGYRWS